jgi:hypothetical protein
LNNIEFVVTEFGTYLEKECVANAAKQFTLNTEHFALIYFDGNHQKKATLDYFDLLLPITNNTVWIFDDIHWSSEMDEAWEMIKNIQSYGNYRYISMGIRFLQIRTT